MSSLKPHSSSKFPAIFRMYSRFFHDACDFGNCSPKMGLKLTHFRRTFSKYSQAHNVRASHQSRQDSIHLQCRIDAKIIYFIHLAGKWESRWKILQVLCIRRNIVSYNLWQMTFSKTQEERWKKSRDKELLSIKRTRFES